MSCSHLSQGRERLGRLEIRVAQDRTTFSFVDGVQHERASRITHPLEMILCSSKPWFANEDPLDLRVHQTLAERESPSLHRILRIENLTLGKMSACSRFALSNIKQQVVLEHEVSGYAAIFILQTLRQSVEISFLARY